MIPTTSPPGWPRSGAARWTWRTDHRAAGGGGQAHGRTRLGAHLLHLHRPGCSSPSSGTRNRPGTTSACGWPPTSPSIAPASMARASTSALQARAVLHPAGQWSTSAPPAYPYDVKRAQALPWPRPATPMASTGRPHRRNDLRRGDREPVVNYLQQVGIRLRLRAHGARGFLPEYGDKSSAASIFSGSGAARQRAHAARAVRGDGRPVRYGTYPEVDGLSQRAGQRRRTPASASKSSTRCSR